MGTHPIFESDFDCLTAMSDSESDFSENEQSQAEIRQKTKKTFKCNICEAVFTRKKNRNTHQLGHSAKNFACETCGKKFQYPSQLKKHMKTHVGYKCEEPGCDFIGLVDSVWLVLSRSGGDLYIFSV